MTPFAADTLKLSPLPIGGGVSWHIGAPAYLSIVLLSVWVIAWAGPYAIARYRAALGPRHCEVAGLPAAAGVLAPVPAPAVVAVPATPPDSAASTLAAPAPQRHPGDRDAA